MTPTVAAELAMSASFVVFTLAAFLYVMPWARAVDASEALAALLSVLIFRHVALQLVSAQRFGFAISDAGRDQIVYGDLRAWCSRSRRSSL